MRLIIKSILITIIFMLPLASKATEIKLKTEIADPVLLSDQQSHKTYVKISLLGFKIEQKADRSPANVAIVLDKSGSMRGEKIKRAKQAAKLAVDLLDDKDTVALINYNTQAKVLVSAKKVDNKSAIKQKIENLIVGGSTALYAGVQKGADEVRTFFDKNSVNRIILLSDGLANIGSQSVKELGDLGAKLGGESVSVTTIGLGNGYDEDLMAALADRSDGNHAFVENAEDLAKVFEQEFGDVLSVVAQDVQIEITLPDGFTPIRIIGRDGEISGQKITSKVGQIYSKQEKYLLIEVEAPNGNDSEIRKMADIKVDYYNMQNKKRSQLENDLNISYSTSPQKVEESVNRQVKSDAMIQIVNEENKRGKKINERKCIYIKTRCSCAWWETRRNA